MSETTDKLLEQALTKALDLASKTGEFVVDMAPELLQEFYLWHTLRHSTWLILSVVLLIGVGVLTRWLKKHTQLIDHWGVPVFLGLLSLLLCVVNLIKLIKITVAPNIYLIEYFLNG